MSQAAELTAPSQAIGAPSRWTGVLILLACATLWSVNGPLIKLLDREGVPATTIAFYRSALAGLIFAPAAIRHASRLRSVHPGWLLASVGSFTIMTACFVLATQSQAASTAIVLQYTSPLWVFALAPLLLNERPRLREGLALLLAMAGVAVIFFGQGGASGKGLIVALAAGAGYGLLTVLLRRLQSIPPALITCLNCAGSAVLLLLWLIWSGWRQGQMASAFGVPGPAIPWLALLSVTGFAIPYLLFSLALRSVPASSAALIMLTETVLNAAFTWLVIGEAVPRPTLLGAPLILGGVGLWIVLSSRRPASGGARL